MPITVFHDLTATTPDNTSYEIRPSHWNSSHVASLQVVGSEVIGAFSNSNNVSFGTTPDGHITVTIASNQSNQTIGLSALGNTTINSASTFDARSMGISGAGNISVGIIGSNIVLSATGGGGGNSLAIAAGTNIINEGTAAFGNANNVSFGADAFGNVTASASYQTGINVSASNAAANLSSIVFGNANGMSFALNGSTLNGSYTVPQISNLLSGFVVSGSNAVNTLTGMTLSDSNGISFGVNNGTVTASYTVPNVAGLISSIVLSASNTSTAASAFNFGNANGVSFGIAGSNVTASVAVQTNQSEGFYALGNTTQGSSGTFDARSMSVQGLGNVSVGFSNGSLVISAVGTAPAGGIALSAGTQSTGTGTVVFGNSNGVSFGLSNGTVTATVNPGPAAGMAAMIAGTQTQTTGTMLFQNSNGISFGMSNSSVVTAIYTVPNIAGLISNINISAGTTSGNQTALTFSNANGLSFGFNNGTITGSYTVPTQTLQPVAISASNGSFAYSTLSLGALNGATFYTTNGSVAMSYTVPSTAGLISAIGLSAGTQASNLSAITFGNANNVSFGLNAGTVTGSAVVNFSAGTQAGGYSAITLANSNGVSFGINNGTITASYTQNAQTNQTVGLYARGSTTGASSSSTYDARSISISGIGNIYVGNSGGAFVIQDTASGGGANTFSGYAVSNTTLGTTGTLAASALSFAGAGAVSIGMSNGSVVISAQAGAQSVQTMGVYAEGNTTGTSSSSYDARFLSFAGLGMITVGNSNGSILISGPNTTTLALLSVGISTGGNTAGNTGLASNQLILFGGSNITLSGSTNAGSMSLTINGATAGGGASTGGVYLAGNTTGQSSSSTYPGSSFNISAAGLISAGWSSNSLIISAPGTTGISQSMYATGNTTQSTSGSAAIGSMLFQGAGNVSVGISNGSVVISGAGGGGGGGVAISAGTNSTSTGTVLFSNSNGVSFGMNTTGVVTASVAAQSNQSEGMYALGNTTGQSSSSTFDARTQSVSGLGAVSVGFSAGNMVISGPPISSVSGTGQVSVAIAGSTISIGVPTLSIYGTSNTTQGSSGTATNGSLLLAGAGNVSVGYSNGSVVISGGGGGAAQTGISGIVVSNTTYTSGTVTWQNANGISFGSSGANGVSASYTVPSQVSLFALGNTTQNSSTVLAFNALSFNGLGEATIGFSNGSIQVSIPPSSFGVSGGNTSGTSGNFSGQVVLAGGNNITLSVVTAAGGAQSITISGAAAGGVQTGISSIVVSNTTYTAGQVSFVNANGISFGSSGASGISASYTVPSTVGLISAFKVSGGGSSVNATALTFSNSNGISFGLSTGASVGTITASVAAQTNQTIGMYALGNTTQNSSTTFDARTISLNGLGALTVGYSNGSVQLSAPAVSSIFGTGLLSVSVNASTISLGVPGTTQSVWMPQNGGPQVATQIGNGVIQVFPAFADANFSASRADIYGSFSVSSSSNSSWAATISVAIGFYTRNGSTLSQASSGSASYAITNTSNNSVGSLAGMRNISLPINLNIAEADYWIAVMSQTASGNTNWFTASNMVYSNAGAVYAGPFGGSSVSTNQSVLGLGQFSATSAALPVSMAFSNIVGTAAVANATPVIAFHNVTA